MMVLCALEATVGGGDTLAGQAAVRSRPGELRPRSPARANTAAKTRGPLLLTAGGNDHTVPAAITTSTRKLCHKSPAITDFTEFPGRGHSLTTGHGWREVAQAALDWLRQRSA
jgi:pimeloyl-ACP methyl ester carboxylesterase